MGTIADAYVQIIPSTEGIKGKLESAMNSEASSAGDKAGGTFGSKFGSAIGSGVKTMAKGVAIATGAAVAGVTALTTAAVNAYADYEQLTGGVETLFGTQGMSIKEYADSIGTSVDKAKAEYQSLETAQNLVMKNASNAFKTSGLSMNEYMETATSSAAAMVASLDGDTEKAAKLTDQAIVDMSDNANKMGTSMESIQNAYSGFAKGNFTMLDNLKLGYGGTKEEMQKLLDKAKELSGVEYDISNYADITEAIHVIQKDMGIAGTTAREATTTIQGSLGMVKAAWENLMTGLGDSKADVGKLVNDLVQTLTGSVGMYGKHINGLFDNLLPVVENALSGIGTLVEKLVPKALDMLPTMITDVLPKITSAATDLVQGLVDSLSNNMDSISTVINQLVKAVVKLLPDVMKLGGQVITTFAEAIVDNLDSILGAAGEILEVLLKGLSEHSGDLVNGAVSIISMLADFIVDNIDLIVSSALQITLGIAQGLMDNLDILLTAAFDIVTALAEALLSNIDLIIDAVPALIQGFVDSLVEFLPEMTQAWIGLMDCIEEAIPAVVDSLLAALPQLIDTLVEYYAGPGFKQTLAAAMIMFGAMGKALAMIALQIVASIGMKVRDIASTIAGEASLILESAKTLFGGIVNGAKEKFDTVITNVKEFITKCVNSIKNKANEFKTVGSNLITGLWNGINDKVGWILGQIGSLGQTILSKIKNVFEEKSPSKATQRIGDYLAQGLGIGWQEGMKDVYKEIRNDLNYEGSIKLATSLDDSAISRLKLAADSSIRANQTNAPVNKSPDLDGVHFTIYETISLDGTPLKDIISEYTINKIGSETRATKISMGQRLYK